MNKRDEIEIERSKKNRTIHVLESLNDETKDFKNETYLELADQLILANKEETSSFEICENGKLLMRVLEKIRTI